MSYYDIIYKGVSCRFEIGGDWNRKFWEASSHKECAQAVIPVWTECEAFMKRLMELPGSAMVVDRSLRVNVDKKTIVVTFVGSSRMNGFWLACGDERLMFTWADSQPAFVKASSSRWVAWFMNHHEDLEEALLAEDTDEDSLNKTPDDPRYLIRVGRKLKEIEDGDMDHITLKEVL